MAKITFKGKEVHTNGQLPEKGEQAPDFSLVRQDFSEVSLETYGAKKKVLNIVPSLDSGVCATSAKKFNQKIAQRDDVVLINISMDLPFAQDRFCKAENLEKIETLSAFRSSFSEDYGVKMNDGPLRGLCARAVVIVDEKNKIIYSQQVPEITEEPDYESALKNIS